MAGPRLREVRQLEQPVKRAEELARSFLRLDREIGPRDVADEEGIARDDEPGVSASRGVGDHVRGVLRPVARRGERCDPDLADGD